MPPKPQAGKKGKDDQEDYSDLPTLPPLNSIISTIIVRSLFSAATREKLQKTINEKLPLEPRIKTVTREELVAYAKLKQIIVEPNVAATLPQDDPRLKMSEGEQLSKALCDKIFELSVLARRAKKEKIQKQAEEEAKLQQQQHHEGTAHGAQQENDNLDLIFNIVDFPLNKAEALAMAKYNMTVSCVLDIQQVLKKSEQEDDEEEAQQLQSQEQPLTQYDQGNDLEAQKKFQERLDQLISARAASIMSSPLRFMYIQPLEFTNWPHITFKINEQGEEVEERKEAEVFFFTQLVQKLEYVGALLLKYQKFREKVPLIPLMPDKQAMMQIEILKQEQEEYHLWLQESEQYLNINSSQKSLNDSNQEDLHQREQRKQEFEQEKQIRAQDEEERKKRLKELTASLKNSIDDFKDNHSFKQDIYKRDFIKNKESKNCISAIMSAMVSQIANGDPHYTTIQTQESIEDAQDSTEAETIDDLFDNFSQEIAYDMLLEKRPNPADTSVDYGKQNHDQSSASQQNRQRKEGTQAFASQNTIIGQVEYHEESDKSKMPIFKLPKVSTFQEEEKAEDICLREKEVLQHLVLPGFNRNLMPHVPTKSDRLRDAERPALYPFSTLPIEDAERALIQRAFQELLKSNFIDEGQPADIKHAKYRAFERCFEQHMKPEILRQVMADALLKEPDVATLYYPRNDSLLVALYNKIKSVQKQEDDFHGEREWKAAYRVMPDFENWVKFFSDELIVPIQTQTNTVTQQSTANLQRYQMDEEMIPDQMLDIDDQKIQNISEKSQMFYPEDGSIMKVDTYSVGGQTFKKSVVYKDNLTFGFRQSQPEPPQSEEEKEYNFYTLKKTGPAEFWLNFENDTKLLVEQFQYVENPTKLMRIDPPKPTPEEIAAREEAIKQAQILAAKNKNKNAPPPVIEEYKEPEPTWEPEPRDYLEQCIEQDYLSNQNPVTQTTVTSQNGLIVKFTQHGDIVQLNEDQIFDKANLSGEKDRVIIRESGVVVRHFRNRDAEVLFPNGQIAHFNKKDMMWIVTNNKGRRLAKKGGQEWDLESIPCATETDAVTNARMMIREDKVMTIQFKDGSLYCQHSDGTLMKTSADGNQIRIEKEGYAPVIIHRGLRKVQGFYTVDHDVQKNIVNPKDRAIDGWLTETHLPDGTIVESFQDWIGEYSSVRHLFQRPDFSVVSIDSTGGISIVSSNARSSLNEQFGRRLIGQDIDYIQAIYNGYQNVKAFGTYHAYIQQNYDSPGIFTVADQLNKIYKITWDNQLVKVDNRYCRDGGYANQDAEAKQNYASNLQHLDDGRGDLEDVGGHKNPQTKNFIHPRLFVVNSDGSGYELLTKEQLEYYFRIAKHRQECLKQRKNVMVGTTLAKTHYFVTKVKNMQDFEIENQHLKQLDFPQNAQYALYHVKQSHQKSQQDKNNNYNADKTQKNNQYLFRQIFEFQEFEIFKQEAFYDDFDRYRQWKMSQVRYDSEFGIVHIPAKDQVLDYGKIEDDEYFSKRIITKILKERRNKRPKFDPDHFKREFIGATRNDEEVTEYYMRGSTNVDREKGEALWRGTSVDQSQNAQYDRQLQIHQQMQESVNMEKIRQIKKKQEQNIQNQIADIRRMINTPTFLPVYFQSKEGQKFTKNNPQKPPSQEMIMRMSQRINRSQHNSDKAQSQFDPTQSQRGADQSGFNQQQQQQMEGGDDKESPIVALEPEDNFNKQGSNFMGSKKLSQKGAQGGPQPSLYIQEKLYVKQREQEQILKAEEYHVVKTKDFNVIGRLRQEKPYVKAIQKSQAQSELNEKFITTECIADRRVKISSMAPRQFINAPSVEDVRKQGQHQMILSAINKKQTFAELINQANSMVTSVLHDPLKRSLNIMPSQLKFGILQAGAGPFELVFTMKNEDSIAQRVTIRPLNDKRIMVQQVDTGPIATGMTRKVNISIQSSEECTIKDTLQIVTKTDIFKIPIEAQFLSAENYQREFQEQRAISGKTLANSRVRNKLNDSIQKGRMSAKGERIGGGSIDGGSDDGADYLKQQANNWIETTNSDSRLPKIPQSNQRPFEVDPKKNLKDLLKKPQ